MKGWTFVVSDDFAACRSFVADVPPTFGSQGTVLHKGRNEVRLVEHGQYRFAVKRFGRKPFIVSLINVLRKTKACRAYRNAFALLRLGIHTPVPVAYMERRNALSMVTDSYYICLYEDDQPIADGLCEYGDTNWDMVRSYARFVASLHSKGILHKDLNSTNVRYKPSSHGYEFSLIDINRMTFYPQPERMPLAKSLENLCLFSHCSPMFEGFVREYLAARGLTAFLFDTAIAVKQRHDRHYARKKRIGRMLKKLF